MTIQLTGKALGESNDQLVYNALKSADGKCTIPEIANKIDGMTDRTVRRCIKDLTAKGFVRTYGKRLNAQLYGLADKSMYEDVETNFDMVPIIPFGGNLMTVNDFLEALVSPERNPLSTDETIKLFRTDVSNGVRRAMAGVILTSDQTGQEKFIQGAAEFLLKIENELAYVLRILKDFNTSGVWHEQYRDRIAFQVRRAQQNNAPLYQLAFDFVRSQ